MSSGRRGFFAELRRRHVFRVAGVYVAVAWAVVQGASAIVPLLELPAWTGKLAVALVVLGFPLALVLSWAYDLTPQGVERTRGEAEPAAERRLPRLSPVGLLAGALGLMVVLAGAILLRYRTVAASPTVVAVLPFSARGNADYLGDGMVDLLSRNLDGVEHLRAVDPATIVTVSKRHTGDPGVDVERGREVAGRLGAGLFVLGNVNEAAGVLRITAALYGQEQTEPEVQASVQGDSTYLFQLVDSLTAQLLAGRKHGSASERLVRTAAVTTASLAALKAYLDGERHLRAAEYDSARAGFQQALELDSTFALASYRLAVAARLGGHTALGTPALERALRFGKRLPERDRRLVEAYAAFQRGDVDRAEQLYGAIRRDYPDDVESTFELAELLALYNPARARPDTEAMPLYRQVLDADPEFMCPI